ncbi:hypothetical protein DFH08DRAFT_1021211 [Mycena albidolilacea]|uniref:Uncharacterized protein n=1 Tax=Mycena albidolilacea TaxID=1033008 RepID=A0AAD6ZPK7_9AGAR|nr:hypothetical protein DFH08DRAFT_1021211 [Mycena albidolilacea]
MCHSPSNLVTFSTATPPPRHSRQHSADDAHSMPSESVQSINSASLLMSYGTQSVTGMCFNPTCTSSTAMSTRSSVISLTVLRVYLSCDNGVAGHCSLYLNPHCLPRFPGSLRCILLRTQPTVQQAQYGIAGSLAPVVGAIPTCARDLNCGRVELKHTGLEFVGPSSSHLRPRSHAKTLTQRGQDSVAV